jgi:hypothetical protein
VIGPGKVNTLMAAPKERLIGYLFAALDELAPLAAKVGTALWVENIPFAMLPNLEEIVSVLDRYGRDNIGIVYDVANGHFVGENIGEALKQCGARLKLVHLSDTNRQLYRHDPIGRGTVPFAEVPPCLLRSIIPSGPCSRSYPTTRIGTFWTARTSTGAAVRPPLIIIDAVRWIQTRFSSSVTGDVITRNTRSTRPEFEMACSTPGGTKIKSCLRTTWFLPAISINPSPSST